jgi:Uncharacterised protein family (UPF0158)
MTPNLSEDQYKRIGDELEAGLKVYIHKKTLNIISLFEGNEFGDFEPNEDDEEYQEIEENSNEYFLIEKMDSRDFYRVMADFVENINDQKDNQFFKNVLNGHKPMANFNFHIHNSEYRESWFVHKKQAYIDYAKNEIVWFTEEE